MHNTLEAADRGASRLNALTALEAVSTPESAPLSNRGVPHVTGVPHGQSSGNVTVTPSNSDVTDGELAATDSAAEATPETSVPESERPCFKVYDAPTKIKESGKKLRAGVFWHTMTKGTKEERPAPLDTWICGPLHIEAQTADGAGNAYGRLLRFKTTRGNWRTWSMPMELLRGSGEELRGELLSMGLIISPDQQRLFGKYLQLRAPKRRMRCATMTGWCGKAFVFPDVAVGPEAADTVFQTAERVSDAPVTAGTPDSWRNEIAVYAVGNPLLLLALSVSFTGPLLLRCHAESGGVHIVGDSSCGKTTALQVAVSAWGGPDYRGSWRATANGLEGAAALHNDGLLALDEISECDPREVGAVVYMVGNGQGKQRATRSGSARTVTRWCCVLLSTGERTIGATMAEGGNRQKAGQGVRLLDIPSEGKHGAFDELHGFSGGREFADHLKTASGKHYGHAARQFVERLASDGSDHAAALEKVRALPLFDLPDLDQQEKRVAGRFALYAYAGELATDYDITGWPEGAAVKAAVSAFKSWRELRGKGRDERRQVIAALADFLDRHGDSRFSHVNGDNIIARDRAGWWEESAQGRVYLFTAGAIKEALTGFDLRRALNVLEQAQIIPTAGPTGERAKTTSIQGRKVKVYRVSPDALGVAHGN